MAKLLAQRKTTDGNIYQKKENVNGRTYYVEKGEGVIAESDNARQAWAGANSKRVDTTEISTPDGYKEVNDEIASITGQMANYEDVDGWDADSTIQIDGETYTAEDLEKAYSDANEEQPDVGAVRYL